MISFNIGGGGQQTITVVAVLPTIVSPVLIDGESQPGYAGTPLIAAEEAGRPAWLMEIDPGYCDVIRQRFAEYTGVEPELAGEVEGAGVVV